MPNNLHGTSFCRLHCALLRLVMSNLTVSVMVGFDTRVEVTWLGCVAWHRENFMCICLRNL